MIQFFKLTGIAKIRGPDVYATTNGLDKLLVVLRGSPLQRLLACHGLTYIVDG